MTAGFESANSKTGSLNTTGVRIKRSDGFIVNKLEPVAWRHFQRNRLRFVQIVENSDRNGNLIILRQLDGHLNIDKEILKDRDSLLKRSQSAVACDRAAGQPPGGNRIGQRNAQLCLAGFVSHQLRGPQQSFGEETLDPG